MRQLFQGGMAVTAAVSLMGISGCGISKRDLGGTEAGGSATSNGGGVDPGQDAAGASGSLGSAYDGATDSNGAGREDSGESSQGGNERGDGGALVTGGVANGGVANGGGGGTAAGSGGIAAGGGVSACAAACESFQFCAGQTCLPSYASTRVIPATDQTNGSGQINSAVVLSNKAQGNIIVQLSGDLVLSDANAGVLATLTGVGYASYTPEGNLAWYRSQTNLLKAVGRESALALLAPADFAVSYVKYDPPTGPVAGTYSFRTSRINGITGNLTWEAKYPTTTNFGSTGSRYVILPRMAQGNLLTFQPLYPGTTPGTNDFCTVTDNGTSGSVTCSGANYSFDGVSGTDGSTAWTWGAPGSPTEGGSYKLNPFASTAWPFAGNPYQQGGFGGEDAFIVGIRGASTTIGPWMTEGDYGPGLLLAALPDGDLAVAASGNGYMTFNGDQSLLSKVGGVLFRLDTKTGQIVWRKPLSQTPDAVIAAPGGRIAVLNPQSGSNNPRVDLFDAATGSALSTLPLPYALAHSVLAAGQTDLFVLGDFTSAFDFNPGPGTDKPSATRGVYISRYSF